MPDANYYPTPPPGTTIRQWVYNELKRVQTAFQVLSVQTNATTTELADAAATINAMGKHTGRQVYNTTTGLPLWASGPGTADTWDDATGTTQHTPA